MTNSKHRGIHGLLTLLMLSSLLTSLPERALSEQLPSISAPIPSEPPPLSDTQRARFKRLVQEIRCVVCQNQNIADSNADLAKDLRREVHLMIQREETDEQILEWMVDRYGEFVLYRPPLETRTAPLWIGPFILIVFALIGTWRSLSRRRTTNESERRQLSEEYGEDLLRDARERLEGRGRS